MRVSRGLCSSLRRRHRAPSRLPLALLFVLSFFIGGACKGDAVVRTAEVTQAVVEPDEKEPLPGPPLAPKPLEAPAVPIEQAVSVGYLPGAGAVGLRGQYTHEIRIEVPPGRSGLEPRLRLSYDSLAGNGVAGVGWSLSGLSQITRCPKTIAAEGVTDGADFDGTDSYCLDGEPYANGATEYRTESDSFARVVGTGIGEPIYFDVYRKDGRIQRYEQRLATRVTADEQGVIAKAQ